MFVLIRKIKQKKRLSATVIEESSLCALYFKVFKVIWPAVFCVCQPRRCLQL